MRKLTVLTLIMLLMFTVGCGNTSTGGNAQTAQKEADGPGVTANSVKIGAWLPTSGAAAINGLPQKLGLDAYYKVVNDKGGVNGRKINFVTVDTERDPQKTLAGAHTLVEQDKVFAIISTFGQAQTQATFPYVLDESKVPLVNTMGGTNDWYNPPKANLYGAMVPYDEQHYTMGKWAVEEGAKTIVVVHDDPKAYVEGAQKFESGVKAADPNMKVQFLPVKLGTQDYVPISLQVIAAKPDAVYFLGPMDELIALTKGLAKQGKKIPIYTFAPNISNDTIKLGGAAVEGMRGVVWTVPPDSDSPAVNEYRQAIKAIDPKAEPDYLSLFSYSTAKIFVEALSRVKGPLTRDNFTKALETLDKFETGLLPPVTYNATKHMGVTDLQRVILQNGKWVPVGGFIEPKGQW